MRYIWLILILFLCNISFAQSDKVSINGYVKDLFMYYNPKKLEEAEGKDISYNLIHNRINFKYFISDKLTFSTEVRNRLFMGGLVNRYANFKDIIGEDKGFLDLSYNLASGDKWFLNTTLDRLYLDYTSGNWQITLGRQRINWGVNLVWNPNDIFNAFSYFDFDYEEKPGTDALKVQYYTSETSSVELVYKFGDNTDEMALAGMYRFAKWNYDFQIIGGWVGQDIVVGGAWAGDIKGAGFRGEFSYFTPRESGTGLKSAFIASMSGDYTFTSQLYIHGGILFNSNGTTSKAGGMDILIDRDLSPRNLSLAQYSVFAQATYPVTPLLRVDFSSIVNPSDGSLFVNPGFSYSLSDNMDLMLTTQLFFGEKDSEFGNYGQIYYARLKWSF
jgi:hypothetical protein